MDQPTTWASPCFSKAFVQAQGALYLVYFFGIFFLYQIFFFHVQQIMWNIKFILHLKAKIHHLSAIVHSCLFARLFFFVSLSSFSCCIQFVLFPQVSSSPPFCVMLCHRWWIYFFFLCLICTNWQSIWNMQNDNLYDHTNWQFVWKMQNDNLYDHMDLWSIGIIHMECQFI